MTVPFYQKLVPSNKCVASGCKSKKNPKLHHNAHDLQQRTRFVVHFASNLLSTSISQSAVSTVLVMYSLHERGRAFFTAFVPPWPEYKASPIEIVGELCWSERG